MNNTTNHDRLVSMMASLTDDPLEFVRVCFPWGESWPLENATGPWPWQEVELANLRDDLKASRDPIRLAVAHGNGAGGTSLLAWIALWAMATRADTRVIVTAAPEAVLRTKTYPTIAFWFDQFIAKHWFSLKPGSMVKQEPEHRMEWRLDLLPASQDHPEQFAGLCHQGKRTVILMDNAASVPDRVWDTVEGCCVTGNGPETIFGAFGTGARLSGRFHECFEPRWRTSHVDTRDVETLNQDQLRQWASDHGEDSDWFRVHVRGLFQRRQSGQRPT